MIWLAISPNKNMRNTMLWNNIVYFCSSPKTPLELPPKFFVDAIKHLEKSEALFCIDRNEVKGKQQFIIWIFTLDTIMLSLVRQDYCVYGFR